MAEATHRPTAIAPLGSADEHAVIGFIAGQQARPRSHCVYAGIEHQAIADEVAEVDAWRDHLLVATGRDGEVVGALLGEVDDEMRRVWWWGPWATDTDVGGALLDDAAARFAGRFDLEELAPDERNADVITLATGRGFTLAICSSLLSLDLGPGTSPPALSGRTEPSATDHLRAVTALHDALFPDTHTTGARLTSDEDTALRVALAGDEVVGYVATQVETDGSGYVAFLGVKPGSRRAGLGRALVGDAVADLAAGGAPTIYLTVRLDAEGARALYLSLGFVEERVIQPCRRGVALS